MPPRGWGPRLELAAAAALFSTGGAAIKFCSFTSWQVAGLRSAIAAVFLLLLLPEARRGLRPMTALVGLAYAATLITFVTANKLTTAANAIYLQSTAPLYLLLLGPWLLREPIRAADVLRMAIVAVGLVFLFLGEDAPTSTSPDPARGNLVAAISGLSWALTVVGLRWLARTGGGAAAAATGNVLVALVALPFALPIPAATAADWGAIAFLGVFQVGLAYVFLVRGLRQVAVLPAALLLLLEPVLNPVWAWLVHDERPNAWSMAGGALILFAAVLDAVSGRRRRPG